MVWRSKEPISDTTNRNQLLRPKIEPFHFWHIVMAYIVMAQGRTFSFLTYSYGLYSYGPRSNLSIFGTAHRHIVGTGYSNVALRGVITIMTITAWSPTNGPSIIGTR